MAIYETKVAKRYAEALFQAAAEKNLIEQVDRDMEPAFIALSDPKFLTFLEQPQITYSEKSKLIDKVFSGMVNPLVISLVKLLLRRARIRHFPAVKSYFDYLTDQMRGVEEIGVVTAVPLADEDYLEILDKMRKYSHFKELRLVKKVKPEILGGVIIELGRGRVMDMSLRTALLDIKRRLVKHRHL